MKAKDYAEKYIPLIRDIKTEEDMIRVARDLYGEYVAEVEEICETRNIKLDRGAKAVFREQNQKWNAMVRLLEADGFANALRRDGFMELTNALLAPQGER